MARAEDGVSISTKILLDDGAVRFVKPDGTVIDSSIPSHQGDWAQLPLRHDQRGIRINARTAATQWSGESCDYGMGIDSLLHAARKNRVAPIVTLDVSNDSAAPEPTLPREVHVEVPFDQLDHSPGASIARWREATRAVTNG